MFKKNFTFYLKEETYLLLKDFVKKRYGFYYGNISKTIEEAIIHYIENPPKSLEEQFEELRKENEFLRNEIEKLKNSFSSFSIIESKKKAEQLREQVKELKTKVVDTNKQNDNLPSFLKDNPWVSILKKRIEEEKVIYNNEK
jgi:predicted RNase H-like nuclease (RuvC/YqgF family)